MPSFEVRLGSAIPQYFAIHNLFNTINNSYNRFKHLSVLSQLLKIIDNATLQQGSQLQKKTSPRGSSKQEKGTKRSHSGSTEVKESVNKRLLEVVNEDSNMSQTSQCSQASSAQGKL